MGGKLIEVLLLPCSDHWLFLGIVEPISESSRRVGISPSEG